MREMDPCRDYAWQELSSTVPFYIMLRSPDGPNLIPDQRLHHEVVSGVQLQLADGIEKLAWHHVRWRCQRFDATVPDEHLIGSIEVAAQVLQTLNSANEALQLHEICDRIESTDEVPSEVAIRSAIAVLWLNSYIQVSSVDSL